MVREESHLDDMRAAIRGDFERLEERRGEQELMRPIAESEPERPLQQTVTTDDSSEPLKSPTRRSWLDRLLGR